MKELVDGMIFPVNLPKLNLLSNPITLNFSSLIPDYFFRNTIILFLESQSTLLDVRRDLGLVACFRRPVSRTRRNKTGAKLATDCKNEGGLGQVRDLNQTCFLFFCSIATTFVYFAPFY